MRFFSGFFILAALVMVSLTGCSKADQASAKAQGSFQVAAVKVTEDIDSTFKVQAAIPGIDRAPPDDLGIVGSIQDGKLTISIPEPTEEQLHFPGEFDFNTETEDIKIGYLRISTSKADLLLENRQNGDSVDIWYANKDGTVIFLWAEERRAALKRGWNFIAPEEVYTSLQEVYDNGYKWVLVDKR
ncbi:hypothetical protein ACYULU_06505 [Breznakiellaceae bacterium SP9]